MPATPASPALVAAAVEQTGAVVAWPVDHLGDPARALRLDVGPYPIGPLVLPSGRLAAASMATRRLRVFAPRGTTPAQPLLDVELPGVPRRMVAGSLQGRGDVLAIAIDARGLVLLVGDTLIGPFTLATERSTALALAHDGSGLWFGSQSPTSIGFVPAAAFQAGAGDVATTRVHTLEGIPRAFAHVDFAGDGEPVLCALGGDAELLFVPTDDGAEQRFELPAHVPLDATALDVDGDGREELIALSKADSSYLVLGNPDGTHFRSSFSEYSGQGSVALAAGDVDGDGIGDLIVANREAQALALLIGRGPNAGDAGMFLGAQRRAAGRNPLDVVLFDVRADGRLGAAAVSGAQGRLTLFDNGGGELVPWREIDIGASLAQVLAGDVDGDGREDLIVLARPSSGARGLLLANTAGAPFKTPVPLAVGAGATRVALATLGGAPVLAVADPSDGVLRVLPRPGSGAEPIELALDPRPAALCAWPGSVPALAVLLVGERSHLVRIEFADAELREVGRLALAGYAVDVAAADLDGDGRADIAVLAREREGSMAGGVAVYLQRGAGLVPGPRATAGAAAQRIALGDLDRDGRHDIAVAAQNRHVVNLWLVRASGNNVALETQPEVGVGLGPMAVVFGDVSGNGWLDIVAVNAFSDDITLVRTLPPH